jgi:hypothetical protein
MSQSAVTTLTCPHCRHGQDFTVWHSVNVSQDPELKPRVLDRSLTTFTCESCGSSVSIEQDLLYHDMDRRLMILRRSGGDDPEGLADKSFGLLNTLSGNAYAFRLVATMNELVEKVLIWEDNLDDRSVEVFKEVVWQALKEDQRGGHGQLFYGGIVCQPGGEAEIELVLSNDSGNLSMTLPLESEFRRLEKQIARCLPSAASEDGKWLRVDRDYARAIIEQQP